jgi:polyhydroxybutyrate depolymerase
LLALALLSCGDSNKDEISTEPDHYAYASVNSNKRCDPTSKPGRGGATNGERSAKSIHYNVRAPLNYDPTRRHGLIMVYAPARSSAVETEKQMGFTRQATHSGFVVAYADHATLGLPAARELAMIPSQISEKWCVDPQRIFLTGHSDGGTITHIAALLSESRNIVRGIAPSAAGVVATDLQAYGCRSPIPALIMHSMNDSLFPRFGTQTAQWWAQCNRCDIKRKEVLPNGCVAYKACAAHAPTWYCESDGGHSAWPDRNEAIIEFFSKQLN